MKKDMWIHDRLPTEDEKENGIVGIVNGYDQNIQFIDAIILVDYDFDENAWVSEDYDITHCKVECWFPLPAYRPTEKGGVQE